MFKKIFIALALLIPTMAFAQKFGTVDIQAVFELMPERAAAQEQIANASKTYEAEYAKLNETFDKEYAEFQALEESNPIRASRMEALNNLHERIQRFLATSQEDLGRQEQTLMAPIQEKLFNAVKKVGADQGFTFIFPNGSTLYTGTDVIDLTEAVKTELGLK